MPSSEQSIDTRLGKLEAGHEHLDGRLDKIESKLDAFVDVASDIRHLKKNMSMMQEPVRDYQTMKHRATGMWMLACGLLSAIGIASTLVGYLLRAFVLKIGTP